MKKKIFSITVVMILLFLATTTVSEARMSIKNVPTDKIIGEPILLGNATIYGDGIEQHVVVTANLDLAATISVNSSGDSVDLQISYDIQCDGDNDLGIILLMAQLNGKSLGDAFVLTTENETGYLKIENVLLEKVEVITILSVELVSIYFNTDPQFHKIAIDTGLSIIREHSRNIKNRIHKFPLIQSLLKLPRIASLFT